MNETKQQIKRREEILLAASQIFSSVGFYRADMNKIAKIANIAKGTVYLYYPSKKELFLAVISEGLKKLSEIIENATRDIKDPMDELKKSIIAYMKFFQENPLLYRILLHPDKEVKEDIETTWQNYTLSKIPSIADTLNKGVELGQFKIADAHTVSYIILGMIDQSLGLSISNQDGSSIEELSEEVLRIIFTGILK